MKVIYVSDLVIEKFVLIDIADNTKTTAVIQVGKSITGTIDYGIYQKGLFLT